ncbi:divergent polysaccharide deacetylase family protein [Futiania mangrovi]|uniref:Divergent polysaccharide deacetylase family protein n=1 Tax=Futiania mangrovi TaxID=2959716 RepID=A0A9J6PI91_9PROT|nr:divergent polysaccharide deacetylase family protein [Futiania mangrovii]MCP1335802.1 divergent polysaccharide deacetylase family protein [Futiania mangrovii]
MVSTLVAKGSRNAAAGRPPAEVFKTLAADAIAALGEPAATVRVADLGKGLRKAPSLYLLCLYAAVAALSAAVLALYLVRGTGSEVAMPDGQPAILTPATSGAGDAAPRVISPETAPALPAVPQGFDFGNEGIGRMAVPETLGLPETVPPASVPAPEAAAPQAEVAALPTVPREVAPSALLPAWRRNAVPPPPIAGRPMIAIIIDDMGNSMSSFERILSFDKPLTLSFFPHVENVQAQVDRARAAGFEAMAHIPMEPVLPLDPGPNALLAGLGLNELRSRLDWHLARIDGVVGVNNHMGSLVTADQDAMTVVMDELSRRGLLFVDSRTSAKSVAGPLARRMQLPNVDRDVFIDYEDVQGSIQEQLEILERKAKKYGFAVGIGHPRPMTLDMLEPWLKSIEDRGFVIVPVTTIVKSLRG